MSSTRSTPSSRRTEENDMPGLLRGVARTAVVAGTASAVAGRVQRRQAAKFADRDAQTAADRKEAYQEDIAQTQPPVAARVAAAPAAQPQADLVSQLRDLAQLRD